ncbi:MAG: protease complex subunit PrcB family protein [Chthonomonadales bacterium]
MSEHQVEQSAQLWSLSGARSSIIHQKTFLIRDAVSFNAMLQEHNPGFEPIPVVDFVKYDVVACFAGLCSTGGYAVTLKSISLEGNSSHVTFLITTPAPGAIVTQAFARPFFMTAVRKLKGNPVVSAEVQKH